MFIVKKAIFLTYCSLTNKRKSKIILKVIKGEGMTHMEHILLDNFPWIKKELDDFQVD